MAPGISTPCVALCTIDRMTGLCVGCGRTPQEIGNWLTYDEATRRAIMEKLPERMAETEKARRENGNG
jgi:predicted Fe-S protein YdhL (DUF1289 family)